MVERIKVGPRPRGSSSRGRAALSSSRWPAPPRAPRPRGRLRTRQRRGLAVVDIAAHKLTKQVVTAPAPFAVDLLSDGRTAYLSNSETNEVVVIDITGGSVKKKIAGRHRTAGCRDPPRRQGRLRGHARRQRALRDRSEDDEPSSGASTPACVRGRSCSRRAGNMAFVMGEAGPSVTIIDTKQNISKEKFVLKPPPNTTRPVLQSAVFSPDGKLLYVTTGPGRSVLIVDPAKKAASAAIDGVGWFPRGIAISPDGKKLYTANGPSDDVVDHRPGVEEGRSHRRRAGRAVGHRGHAVCEPRGRAEAGILRLSRCQPSSSRAPCPRTWSRRSARAWQSGPSSPARRRPSGARKRSRTTSCSRPIRRRRTEAVELLVGALKANHAFQAATWPEAMLRPLFCRYGVGMKYGDHVDGAIMGDPGRRSGPTSP